MACLPPLWCYAIVVEIASMKTIAIYWMKWMIKFVVWWKNPADTKTVKKTVHCARKDKRCFFSSFRRFLCCKCLSVVGKRLDVFVQATKQRASFITGIWEVTCYFWFNCFCQNKVKRKICQICHIVKFAVNMITNAPGAKKMISSRSCKHFHYLTPCGKVHGHPPLSIIIFI